MYPPHPHFMLFMKRNKILNPMQSSNNNFKIIKNMNKLLKLIMKKKNKHVLIGGRRWNN